MLKGNNRQSDPKFIQILNSVRVGNVPQSVLEKLDHCLVRNKARPDDGIEPTLLFCMNKDVDSMNRNKLDNLDTQSEKYSSKDFWRGEIPGDNKKKMETTKN